MIIIISIIIIGNRNKTHCKVTSKPFGAFFTFVREHTVKHETVKCGESGGRHTAKALRSDSNPG